MVNDDIRDLLGRYATSSLTEDEQKRLSAAALEDQDVFDELAREQEMKKLIDEPGVRDRLIRSLEPPKKRKFSWMLAAVPVGVLSAALIVFLMRPAPQPQPTAQQAPTQQVAENIPAAPPVVESAPQPVKVEDPAPPKAKQEPVQDQSRRNALALDNLKAAAKEKDSKTAERSEVAAASSGFTAPAAAPPPPLSAPALQKKAEAIRAQQFSPGGPRQDASSPAQRSQAQNTAAQSSQVQKSDVANEGFGFHYSVETKGHLTIIPGADGYLLVKSASGSVLYPQKKIAAGIRVDVATPEDSLTIVFSIDPAASPSPTVKTELEGTVKGQSAIAIELRPQR